MTDKEKIDAAKRIKVVVLSDEKHCRIVIRIIHQVVRKLKIWPFGKLDSPKLIIQKSKKRTTTWTDLKAAFRCERVNASLRKWDFLYTEFTTTNVWNVDRKSIFDAFLDSNGKLQTKELDSLFNCIFPNEKSQNWRERAADIAADDEISLDEFTQILWLERPEGVKDAEDNKTFRDEVGKWMESMKVRVDKKLQMEEENERVEEDRKMQNIQESIKDGIKDGIKNGLTKVEGVIKQESEETRKHIEKGKEEMKNFIEEKIKKLSNLMVNLTLDASDNHRIPHKVIILPGRIDEAMHYKDSQQGQHDIETDSKLPVIDKKGLKSWMESIYKRFNWTKTNYLLWIVDEGYDILGKSAPQCSSELQKPFNGPFELTIPSDVIQEMAPYIRFFTTILVGAQAVAGIAGVDAMIPTDLMQEMGKIDENLWKDLKTILPADAEKEAKEFPKERKVVGRTYQLLKELILNEDRDKQPKDRHGFTIQYYLDNGLIKRVIKDNKTLHFVSTAHDDEELKKKGCVVHRPLVGGGDNAESEAKPGAEDCCLCCCGGGGGAARVSPAPLDTEAAAMNKKDEVIDRQPAASG